MSPPPPTPPSPGPDKSKSPLVQQIEAVEKLRGNGQFKEAFTRIERIVQGHPSNVRALNEKGLCLRALGQPIKAGIEIRKARKLAPESPELLANLADCLRDEGDYEKAARAFQKALEIRPSFASVHMELGATLQAMGLQERAIASYKTGMSHGSTKPGALANFGSVNLEVGRPDVALEYADKALARDPRSRRAMSVRGFALHELGRDAEAAEIFDPDLIRPFAFETIDGFESLEAFNKALSTHVMRHPTLQYEPANRSTTKGEQTGELLEEPKGPVAALEKKLAECVTTFLADLPVVPDHPYLHHRPTKFRYNVWGTCLGSQGHQAPHIHPSAWVSGAYYAQLPPEMSSGEEDKQGWIEFGAAPHGCKLERKRPLRLIAPKEGTVVLFPSYFYHRTLPFESKRRRISIAFDANPMD
jgi:uncharacterized protein (TIGR02466 family)